MTAPNDHDEPAATATDDTGTEIMGDVTPVTKNGYRPGEYRHTASITFETTEP